MSEMTTPSVRIKWPGQRATDARIAVTIREPSVPFPVVVYFVRVVDDERPGAIASINVGIELGERFDVSGEGGGRTSIERLPRPLDRVAVEDVASRFRQYVEFARAQVEFRAGGPTTGSRKVRRRREMTDDFLSTIARQYTEWSETTGRAVTEIARAHGVNRSTASRWVDAARDRGFLPTKGASE